LRAISIDADHVAASAAMPKAELFTTGAYPPATRHGE
jgi:hypothetical protein